MRAVRTRNRLAVAAEDGGVAVGVVGWIAGGHERRADEYWCDCNEF